MMEAADSVYQQQAAATGAWVEDTAAQYWQQRDLRERATGRLGELGASGCAVPPAGDYTPAELPRRYAFLYGDEDVYRAVLHQCVASTGAVDSTGGRKRGFASWPATFEGVAGHVFALTTAQFALLDQLFPSCVARNSVLANISQGSDVSDGAQSSTGVSEGAPRARRQTLACSTWIKAPLVEGGSNNASVAHRTGVDGPAPGSKRSLLVTSIGSVTDLDLEEQAPTDPPAAGSYAQPATVAPPSLRGSFGSDMRLSFGSDWRTSLPDLDLLPDMLDHTMPIPAVAAATATASLAAAAMPSTTAGRSSKPPRKPRSHPTKMKKTQECDDRPAAALTATAGYEAQVRSVGLLPRGPDGRPKPSSPWIAAIVYWASSSDHALLTRATGISVTKPARFGADTNADASAAAVPMETAAEFRIITLGHPTKQAFGREATIDSGVALVGPAAILRCCRSGLLSVPLFGVVVAICP